MATDPLPIAQDLIRCASVTPADEGAIAVLERALEPLGFACTRLRFGEVENIFAIRRSGGNGPHLCFAGHTDVVPPGEGWTHPPFAAEVAEGTLYGRGAVDMKGGVAAFVAAATDAVADGTADRGTLSFLITGDEEGDAVDGTTRVLDWMEENHLVPDMCLVGEPTSKERLGDTIKIGRRGSLSATITVHGVQGHVAYPDRADNPIHRLARVLCRLTAEPLDAGTEWFQPSTLQVTTVDVGNPTGNIVPGKAVARLNIRFNDTHTAASLEAWIRGILLEEAPHHEATFSCSGEAFLTKPGPFVDALRRAVRAVTGEEGTPDTGGGTSDARFITRLCPVAELGAVGTTMHKVDERTPVEELRRLSTLYGAVIRECLC
ncbi:succinyl-diaminopimelate desuccinylase [Roseomonas xinghualingensis]|uniref:succinyl-diaminopimelate desuccinylase n=1 Tax=Roseomonas xinghualingensis TaxID=2986475 RepID=UPI0021F1FCB1|nr:succinyl-diaminopimelate desuccinylase [Roseomonas sp. SXEYE001]MCV4208059.1 succinyl-diaminopimelate desuccinylase [Roseomonas sp. SXEYE001]